MVWVSVGAVTLIQRRTPGALPGRVDAALIAAVTYRILLLAMAAVIASSAGYLASRREPADAAASCVLQQADSMPREAVTP